jgi:hypothetical protein
MQKIHRAGVLDVRWRNALVVLERKSFAAARFLTFRNPIYCKCSQYRHTPALRLGIDRRDSPEQSVHAQSLTHIAIIFIL